MTQQTLRRAAQTLRRAATHDTPLLRDACNKSFSNWSVVKPVVRRPQEPAAGMAEAASASSKIIKRRALQCSFSSVFYMKDVLKPREFERVKRIFVCFVMAPLVGFGSCFVVQSALK